MERDSDLEAERERAPAGDWDLDFDLDLARGSSGERDRERDREPRSGSPASSSLLGGSGPFDTDFLEESLRPDLERDLERDADLDLDRDPFLLFLPSFLPFLLLGLRLCSSPFWAPLLRSSSSFLPLLFLLWDRLRERDAALRDKAEPS